VRARAVVCVCVCVRACVRETAFRIGEIINKRYTVHASHGKGVFSTVLIAKDAQNDNIDVAIKVIRNNDTMYVQHSLSSGNVL
jgi:hypothetical protein